MERGDAGVELGEVFRIARGGGAGVVFDRGAKVRELARKGRVAFGDGFFDVPGAFGDGSSPGFFEESRDLGILRGKAGFEGEVSAHRRIASRSSAD